MPICNVSRYYQQNFTSRIGLDSENQQIRIFLEMAKFVTPHTTGHYEPSWGNFSDGKVELSSYSSDKIELLQHSARQDNRQQKSWMMGFRNYLEPVKYFRHGTWNIFSPWKIFSEHILHLVTVTAPFHCVISESIYHLFIFSILSITLFLCILCFSTHVIPTLYTLSLNRARLCLYLFIFCTDSSNNTRLRHVIINMNSPLLQCPPAPPPLIGHWHPSILHTSRQ